MDEHREESEVVIENLVVELAEGDDPLAGEAMAQQLVRQLAQLLEE